MAYNEYLKDYKFKKAKMKVFLSNKTMLSGMITDFDEDCIIIDKCMIFREQIISITPE